VDDVMLQKKIIDLLRNGIVMDVGIEYPNDDVIPIPTLYHGKFVGVSPSGKYILISTQWIPIKRSTKKSTLRSRLNLEELYQGALAHFRTVKLALSG